MGGGLTYGEWPPLVARGPAPPGQQRPPRGCFASAQLSLRTPAGCHLPPVRTDTAETRTEPVEKKNSYLPLAVIYPPLK